MPPYERSAEHLFETIAVRRDNLKSFAYFVGLNTTWVTRLRSMMSQS